MKKVFKVTMRQTKKYILGILICSILSSFLTIYLTKFISFVIDGVIMQKSELPKYITNFFYDDTIYSKLIILTIFMLIIIFTISISNYIKNMFNTNFKLKMNKNLKEEILDHTTYLEYSEYISYGKNQILQRVSSDADNFVNFITSKYNLVVDSIFIFTFSMIEILNLNLIVSITIAVILFIIIIMSIIYFKLTKKIVRRNVDLHENLIQKTMNAIYQPKMIKIFNRQEKEIADFNNVSDEYRKNDKKLIDYLIYYELIGTGIRKFKDPVIFLMGGLLIINGKLNIGQLMVLMTYSSNLLEYAVQLIYAVEGINNFLIPAKRIDIFLALRKENGKISDTSLKDISIEFKNVTIQLNNTIILDNVSFKIEKGQTVYLVGDNGSGKSLIVRTLLGFIPYEGQILLGNNDIKNIDNKILRNNLGVIFQEPFIFSDTVRNNIDIFNNYKQIEKIRSITNICEIDDEIIQFPNGYNEIIGERGITLSGGQRQRISIARVLLQNKSIMIFDDVLSKVDNKTKTKIINNLNKFNSDIIKIYITQDLANIPNKATVFFIDNKKIICDNQENLKKQNKNYSKLIDICNNIVGELYE